MMRTYSFWLHEPKHGRKAAHLIVNAPTLDDARKYVRRNIWRKGAIIRIGYGLGFAVLTDHEGDNA